MLALSDYCEDASIGNEHRDDNWRVNEPAFLDIGEDVRLPAGSSVL